MRTNPPLPKLLLALCPALGVVACASGLDGTGAPSGGAGDDASTALASGGDDASGNADAGFSSSPPAWEGGGATPIAFDAGSPPHDADAGVTKGPPRDAAGDGPCTAPLGPGVLVIDEMMIESVAGTDYGQWIEIASTSSCAVDLSGLHAECPVGSKVRTLDVGEDVWIPPGGLFVIADSTDPAINHYLPGTVLAWDGSPGSVLKKDGGTVSLMANGAIVDSVTWPKLAVVVGASVAFPADCQPSDVSDWTKWQTSTASWFPGFYGTPNAPNTDVSCP
jgi:hypothetical protein